MLVCVVGIERVQSSLATKIVFPQGRLPIAAEGGRKCGAGSLSEMSEDEHREQGDEGDDVNSLTKVVGLTLTLRNDRK